MPMSLNPPPDEVVRGWTDLNLSDKGESEAERLARGLKGRGLAMLIASDLDRAVETAEIIEKLAGVPLVGKTPELRTWGLGEMEGMPLKDAQKIIHEYVMLRPNDKPKGGESFNQFIRRVIPKVDQVMESAQPHGVSVGVVTHHWVIEVIYAWVEAGAKPDFSMNKRGLFMQGQEPPGTAHDIWQEYKNSKWEIKRVDINAPKKPFKPGPVLIRHASTAWNAGGKG